MLKTWTVAAAFKFPRKVRCEEQPPPRQQQVIPPEKWAALVSTFVDPLEGVEADLKWCKQDQQRMGLAQTPANDPVEDRGLLQELCLRNGQRVQIASVIDGHGGWQVAEFVQKKLAACLEAALNEVLHRRGAPDAANPLTPEEIETAATTAFERLDASIANRLRAAYALGLSRTARVGACCVCGIVTDEWIVVANSGDCQAVLGTAASKVVPMSAPHCADDAAEQQRLRREHPGEKDIYQCHKVEQCDRLPQTLWQHGLASLGLLGRELKERSCYVKGRLQPTRSFGDFYLKDKDFSFDHENGRPFVRNGASYPYITVTPEIRSTRRRPNHKFILLGSDGVWDFLTHQEAVSKAATILAAGSAQGAAEAVVKDVLEEAGRKASLSLEQMARLPATQKRKVHDDTTVVLLCL